MKGWWLWDRRFLYRSHQRLNHLRFRHFAEDFALAEEEGLVAA